METALSPRSIPPRPRFLPYWARSLNTVATRRLGTDRSAPAFAPAARGAPLILMMDRVARLAQFRAQLLHLGAELRPVAGSKGRQGTVVVEACGGEISLAG